MNKIFPIEILENSVELHRYQHLKKSRVIYSILLLCITLLILMVLFVSIDHYAFGPGIIRVDLQNDLQHFNGMGDHGNENIQSENFNLSPASDLIVECFVSPSDVGFLNENDPVYFQIDGFPFEQWGMAKGKIMYINDDTTIIREKPKYVVTCSLFKASLIRSKNISAKLKPGMKLKAKFKVAKGTILQLLFNKIENRNA